MFFIASTLLLGLFFSFPRKTVTSLDFSLLRASAYALLRRRRPARDQCSFLHPPPLPPTSPCTPAAHCSLSYSSVCVLCHRTRVSFSRLFAALVFFSLLFAPSITLCHCCRSSSDGCCRALHVLSLISFCFVEGKSFHFNLIFLAQKAFLCSFKLLFQFDKRYTGSVMSHLFAQTYFSDNLL